jgi:N-acylglucosamine 2-epimerase
MDESGRFYFALNREGQPLAHAYSIFSDCFAALAFGELARATGDEGLAELARRTFAGVIDRRDNPKGVFEKAFPGTRPLQSLALPMILLNLTYELAPLLDATTSRSILDSSLDAIMNVFWDPERRLLREHVLTNGAPLDSFEGRLLNPGHGLEAMGFVMEVEGARGNLEAVRRAASRTIDILERGWDAEHGGIFYFLDADGHPSPKLEWDQKLWWVHVEALVALATAHAFVGESSHAEWFEKVHEYTWAHFPDPVHGEWFGYLNRVGDVLLPLKGGKWKGFFHVPRGLLKVWRILGPA